MKLRVFSIPFDPQTGFDNSEIDSFCTENEIIEMKNHWFEYGGLPWLAVLVTYNDSEKSVSGSNIQVRKKEKDPRGGLTAEEKLIYDALRDWRSLRANSDGVPTYLVFNNKHLAELARHCPKTKKDLGAISGIGPGKIERYSEDVFSILTQTVPQP